MCGIVGYVGNKDSLSIIIKGLKRLEYRGYDSSGVAISDGNTARFCKSKGKINKLEKMKGVYLLISKSLDKVALFQWKSILLSFPIYNDLQYV